MRGTLVWKRVGHAELMVDRTIVAQRCPHPNSQNLWPCYHMWQMRFCKCEQVKHSEMGKLFWNIWAGPMQSKNPYEKDTGGLESEEMWPQEQKLEWHRAMSQGMQTALEAKKEKNMDSPLKPTEGTQPCWHLDLSPLRLIMGFWPPELEQNELTLF